MKQNGDDVMMAVVKMKLPLRMLAGVAMLACMVFGASTAFAASASATSLVCSGGDIAAGTYASLTVTGVCDMPNGLVTILGDVKIKPNAALNASSPTATVVIKGNVWVGSNAAFVLGCSPAFGCETTTSDRIDGNVYANQALGLIFHSNIIHGTITLNGGGGGVNCNANPLFQGPIYSTFEDNRLYGHVIVSGYQSCWFGFIRNQTHATVTLLNNIFADPDAMETVTNRIWGNLVCYGNSPAPQIGDSGGAPNVVFGNKVGQCASL